MVGDFDADGLTGLAILLETLRWLGLEVESHVPDRSAEGHGLSLAAVERAHDRGCSLIFTVDSGSTSHAEIEAARERGIDVIITDHHAVPAVPPRALALVNPHRPDSRYPDARLSGAGVAFKVAQLLMGQRPGGAEAALGLADLAAIGSVADVMPMDGENRCIMRLGLGRLSEARRPGLAALMASARLDPARIELEDLGFALAPRINAMGRVGDAAAAAELLSAPDRATADALAARLEEANDRRRQLMADALAEARAAAEARGWGPSSSSPGTGHWASSGWSPAASRRSWAGPRWSSRTRSIRGAARPEAPAASTWWPPSTPAPTSSSATAVTLPRPAATCPPSGWRSFVVGSGRWPPDGHLSTVGPAWSSTSCRARNWPITYSCVSSLRWRGQGSRPRSSASPAWS